MEQAIHHRQIHHSQIWNEKIDLGAAHGTESKDKSEMEENADSLSIQQLINHFETRIRQSEISQGDSHIPSQVQQKCEAYDNVTTISIIESRTASNSMNTTIEEISDIFSNNI